MVMVVFIVGNRISNRIFGNVSSQKSGSDTNCYDLPEFNNEMRKDQDNQQEFLE